MVYITDHRDEARLRASQPLSYCVCITVREVLTQEDMSVLWTMQSPAEFAESKLWAMPSLTKTRFDYCRVNVVYGGGRPLSRRVCITVREVLTQEGHAPALRTLYTRALLDVLRVRYGRSRPSPRRASITVW